MVFYLRNADGVDIIPFHLWSWCISQLPFAHTYPLLSYPLNIKIPTLCFNSLDMCCEIHQIQKKLLFFFCNLTFKFQCCNRLSSLSTIYNDNGLLLLSFHTGTVTLRKIDCTYRFHTGTFTLREIYFSISYQVITIIS